MGWLYLAAAGLLEIGWAVGLKRLYVRFSWLEAGLTLAILAGSMALLGLALRTIPLSTGYAAWTAIGIAGTTLFGIVVLGEPATALKLGALALVAAGVVALKIVG